MAKNYIGFRRRLAREVEEGIFDGSVNPDEQTCPKCGGYMPFHGGTLSYGEGYWGCESCGFTVTENEIEKYKPEVDGELWNASIKRVVSVPSA